MKNFMRFMMVCMLIVAMTVSMAACGAAEPAATTAATEAPVAVAPTEPEETKSAFVPERYEPTLPPEPTVPETEPTEPATEPVEEDEDDTYYEENNDYTPAPTEAPAPAPEAPAETTPPATEAPAPVETAPPETEAPVTVSFDYNAAANYGNSYAASTYGWIVDASVEGYYPASSISIDDAINNGGQSYINARMASKVDSTAWNLGGGTFGVWCDCWESDGWIYFVVYYG